MTTAEAPSVNLAEIVARIAPIAKENAEISERECNLAQPVVEAMIEERLFKTLTPRSLGGLEMNPVEYHDIIEMLARVDGSTAWCAWIPGAGAWGASTSPDDVAEETLSPKNACGAGALFPMGRADAVEGGYRVSGRWPYASGCGHATTLGGACNTFDGDKMRMSPFGMPEIRMVSVPASEARILDTWHVSGLAGTGSHDITIEDKFVAERYTRSFGPGVPKGKHFQSKTYDFPFLGIFGSPIASVACGIAQGAIDEAIRMSQTRKQIMSDVPMRERPVFQLHIADAIAALSSARAWHREEVAAVWTTVAAGGLPDLAARARMNLAAANATRSAAHATQLAYIACGGAANYLTSPLQRALRDVHATTQHAGTSPNNFEGSIKLILGLAPDNPMYLI